MSKATRKHIRTCDWCTKEISMTTPRAGEPDMPDLTRLKAICAQATPGEWKINLDEGGAIQVGPPKANDVFWVTNMIDAKFVETFNPTLIARLLAVCEAAQGYLDYLDSGNLKPHGGEERRQAIRLALTALGGQE